VCCITGEAGIGKTSLIDAFVAGLGDAVVAHGQCIEQVGAGEPYLPVLDALAGLVRRDAGVLASLRSVAPTWLLQMPWLIEAEEQQRLRATLASSTQERMLREFAELVEQLTIARPLLLVTEDLHWCDGATVRLLDHVARRRPPARLMWIASFRIAELVAEEHPLNGVRHELRARRLCDELLLDPFSEAELMAYLAGRRPELARDERAVRRLHRQTDGLPLFVAVAVDDIAAGAPPDRGAAADDWAVSDTLAGVIERQLLRAPAGSAALLEAAAVCGVEFEVSVLAAVMAADAADVAARCDELARRQYWLRPAALETRADGTLEPRFAFRHALHRQVLYHRVGAAARAALHRLAAQALGGDAARQASAAVALHHERGLEPLAALRAWVAVAETALGRFAPREALAVTDHALELLPRCPDGVERMDAELALMQVRGAACAHSIGIGTPQAREAFRRAAQLCELLPPSARRAWALSGLAWMLMSRGEYALAEQLARRLLEAARQHEDRLLQATAAAILAAPNLQWGRLEQARPLLEEAIALTQGMEAVRLPNAVLLDPVAISRGVGAILYAHLGEVDRARATAAAAIERAAAVGQPITRGFIWRCIGMVMVRLDEAGEVLEVAGRLREHVREHGLAQGEGPARTLLGWAHARSGNAQEGHRELVEGMADMLRLEAWFDLTMPLQLAAEAARLAGDPDAAREHVEEGFAVAERLAERLHLPDLWLRRAELAGADVPRARACIREALRVAEDMGARTVALAARLAMCRLPDAGDTDRADLRACRETWGDTAPFALLHQADALLAGS
jgi:tetratricopeptide (TPR) repeat protein